MATRKPRPNLFEEAKARAARSATQPAILHLHTVAGSYARADIMRQAWTRARNAATRCAKLGDRTGPRAHLADALRQTWDEARSARTNAAWRAERDAEAKSAEALDARTREIADLNASLAAADGIDSTRTFLATRGEITSRLAELRAA